MSIDMNVPLPADDAELHRILIDWFTRSMLPDRDLLLGFEYECLRVVRADGTAAPSRGEGSPDALVRRLARRFCEDGVEPEVFEEAGNITIIKLGMLNFSLEPGGQIEISFPPYVDPCVIAEQIERFVTVIDDELAGSPYAAVFLGHQPLTRPQDILLRAKPRYEVMNRRLAARGDLGIHMMRATAGMQVTVDARGADDCASLLRATLVSAPIVTAIFANSPLVGGEPSGYLSYREAVWWDTDPSRCGIPPQCLADDAGLGAYVDWALDAEPWFVRRGGDLREVRGVPRFRDMIGTEWAPTLDDFSLHTTTLFPSARLRGGVEVRSADCVSAELAKSFCALIAGFAYDAKARARVQSMHARRDAEGLRKLHSCSAKFGLAGRCGELVVKDAALELLDASRAGLQRQVEAGRFGSDALDLLDPLDALVESGRSPAEELLARYEASGARTWSAAP